MAPTQMSSSRNELFFLKFDIDDLKGPILPTNGDVLRYYFNRRRSQPKDAPRVIARVVVDKCRRIWSEYGIPTTQEFNGVKYLLKMLSKFNDMRQNYNGLSVIHQRQTMAVWQEKFQVMFSIATKDALERCSEESREMLLAAKEKEKEFRKATNNDKWLNDLAKQEKMLQAGSLSAKQSKDNDVGEDTKKSTGQQRRKRHFSNRPGPKSSKKRNIDDAAVKESTIASVTAILSNSDTLNNNQTAKSITTSQHQSTSIHKEMNSMKHPTNAVSPDGLDVQPEEEDIVPPMVQKTIVKEEVDMDWDQEDNWSTSLLFHQSFSMGDKENSDPFGHLVNLSQVACQM